LKETWKKQVKKEIDKNGDVYNRDKWREVVKSRTMHNPANSVDGEETGSKLNR